MNPIVWLAERTLPRSEQADVHAHGLEGVVRINAAELLAVLVAVNAAEDGVTLALMTDSKVARAWVRRGIAPSEDVNELLCDIADACSRRGIRLLVSWVASGRNPADAFTRDDGRVGRVGIGFVRPDEGLEVTTWTS